MFLVVAFCFAVPNCGLVPSRLRLTQLPLRIRAASAAALAGGASSPQPYHCRIGSGELEPEA